jgi:hypothetical protein
VRVQAVSSLLDVCLSRVYVCCWICSCRIPWSAAIKPGSLRYPEPLHQLVNFCLSVDPERRPTVAQVLARVSELASCPDGLADPFPAAG